MTDKTPAAAPVTAPTAPSPERFVVTFSAAELDALADLIESQIESATRASLSTVRNAELKAQIRKTGRDRLTGLTALASRVEAARNS